MNKALSTLTAATAGVTLAVASTSAKAFVIAPAVAAAVLAGGVLGGAALGSAASNAYNYPAYPTVVAPAAPVAVAPSVTVNSTTCYYTHRWINHVRTRVRVCRSPGAEAELPLAAAPATAPLVAPAPVYGAYGYYGYEPAPVGGCEIISGNRVCF